MLKISFVQGIIFLLLSQSILCLEVFTSRQELLLAVDKYLDADFEDVTSMYGRIEDWDVSRIVSFAQVFDANRNPKAAFFNEDIQNWNLSSAVYLNDFFKNNTSFDGNLSSWKVDNVQIFTGMFSGASNFTGIGLSKWNVSNGKVFTSMLAETTSLNPSVDLRGWDVRNAKNMKFMFRNSAFGLFSPQNNLCSWRVLLDVDILKFEMFKGSQCPFTGTPVINRTEAGRFCVYCDQISGTKFTLNSPNDITEQEGNSVGPTLGPTVGPTTGPTTGPTLGPTSGPTIGPTVESTPAPTSGPTIGPTTEPTPGPTSGPTIGPPAESTPAPTSGPTIGPTVGPTASSRIGEDTPEKPNVLMIITDQQRFDTIRRVQDELQQYSNVTKIETPNLDKLSREGAFFRNAYCQCSVCAPARATLRTGCTVERTGIQHNDLTKDYVNSPLFTERVENLRGLDKVLGDQGYKNEYYGKWHLPSKMWESVEYNDYNYNTEEFYFRDDNFERKYRRFLSYYESQGQISRALEDGMQQDTFGKFPYTPIQIDSRFGSETGTALTEDNGFPIWQRSQPNVCGENKLSEEYTNSFFIAEMASKALDRLVESDDPFLMTVSFHNPHPPMVPAKKHLDYYKAEQSRLFVSHNLYDDMTNTDYNQISRRDSRYQDREIVQEWTASYYALIEEIDELVGRMLRRLGDKRNNTLIIFTSDHGEMLGAHGKREKNNFYEESARVPLFISFPGKIEKDTIVDGLVSHLDVFSTILDYIGLSDLDQSDGSSLRSFIDKKSYNEEYDEDTVVAEWDFRKPYASNNNLPERPIDERPSLMIRKGDYKLMIQKKATSPKVDMMFDLATDAFEMNNLLGMNAESAAIQTIEKAEHLRCLLLEWMTRMDGKEKKYYSDPIANFGQGIGDIAELNLRQSWPSLDFWVSDRELAIGQPVWNGSRYIRNEYLYFGRRSEGSMIITDISITGDRYGIFQLASGNERPLKNIWMTQRDYIRLKVMFSAERLDNIDRDYEACIQIRFSGNDAVEKISLRLKQ